MNGCGLVIWRTRHIAAAQANIIYKHVSFELTADKAHIHVMKVHLCGKRRQFHSKMNGLIRVQLKD